MADDFFDLGWIRFGADPQVLGWLNASEAAARRSVTDPAFRQWHRCGGTWFAGVNALANDAAGAVAGGPPLGGEAVRFAAALSAGRSTGTGPRSRSAIRVIRSRARAKATTPSPTAASATPPMSTAAAGRAGAPPLPARTSPFHPRAAGRSGGSGGLPFRPLEGSHRMVRETLAGTFGDRPPASWRDIDLTNCITRSGGASSRSAGASSSPPAAARPFCAPPRPARHRAWREGAAAGERMVIYFRPESGDPAALAPRTLARRRAPA